MAMEFKELSAHFHRGNKKLQRMIEGEIKDSALRMEARSKGVAFSGFQDQSGKLRQSIKGIFEKRGNTPTATLMAGDNNINYATFIEHGTRSIKGRFFLQRSFDVEEKNLNEKFRKMLKPALQER